MASFPQSSPPIPCAQFYPPPYEPHAPPISFVSLYHPHNIGEGVQLIQLMVKQAYFLSTHFKYQDYSDEQSPEFNTDHNVSPTLEN